MTEAARKRWTLVTVNVATFMLLLDITVVNTALPAIEEDLGASFTELQWVIDAYTSRWRRSSSPPGRLPTASGAAGCSRSASPCSRSHHFSPGWHPIRPS
jgi:hypothetical protein